MTLLAVTLGAAAILMYLAPSPVARRLTRVVVRPGATVEPVSHPPESGLAAGFLATARGRTIAAAMGGLAVTLVMGSPVGIALGAPTGFGAWFGLRQLSAAQTTQAPSDDYARTAIAAELLSASVRAGCPTVLAAAVVGSAVGGHLGEVLSSASATAQVGCEPSRAWSSLTEVPSWRPLGRALAAAGTRGTSPVRTLQRVAFDARSEAKWAAESRARALGAKAAAPLGLCFLPAFVLLAIVPIIVTSF